MAKRTSKGSAKVAKNAAARRVAAKAAKLSGARWMAPKAGSCRLPKRWARDMAQTGISRDTMI